MRGLRTRERAFTVLELLIALGLASMIMVMAYQLITQANRISRRQTQAAADSRAAWVWMFRACRELRMALPPAALGKGAEFKGSDGRATLRDVVPPDARDVRDDVDLTRTKLDDDRIRFAVSRADLGKDLTGPRMIEYSLMRNHDKTIVGISRRVAPVGAPPEQVRTQHVNNTVVSMDFRYMDAKGKWLNVWRDASQLPRAVRVTAGVLIEHEGAIPLLQRLSTVVYLPVGTRVSP